MNDTVLQVYCNGEISYTIKGVHAKTSVIWRYRAPNGAGDTHLSVMRSTKSNLTIKQGLEEKYKPTLYIAPLFYNKVRTFITPCFQKSSGKVSGNRIKKNSE